MHNVIKDFYTEKNVEEDLLEKSYATFSTQKMLVNLQRFAK